MKDHQILAIGEVLFDVIDGENKLGGAPFNVAAHLAKLGHQSFILSGIGQDDLGRQILQEAKALHVDTRWIHQHPSAPTGTVLVTFDSGEPQYEIVENVAWDFLEADLEKIGAIPWEVAIFGSLAQRSPRNQKFYSALFQHLKSKWRYFDCNLRKNYFSKEILERSIAVANICKFNEAELNLSSQLLYGESMDAEAFARQLHEDHQIEVVVYTWGKEGARAWYRGKMVHRDSEKIQVKDTIGAGDAFNAGFLHRWMRSDDVKDALEYGNKLGAFVASRAGAIPDYDPSIKTFFNL